MRGRGRGREREREAREKREKRSNVVEETADGGDYSGLKYSGIHAGKAADTDLYRSHLSQDRQRRHTATVVPAIARQMQLGWQAHYLDNYTKQTVLYLCVL